MGAVLYAYGNRVDLRVFQQIVVGFIYLSAIPLRHVGGTAGHPIVISDQLDLRVGGIFRQMAHLRDLTAADHTDPDPVHSCASSLLFHATVSAQPRQRI